MPLIDLSDPTGLGGAAGRGGGGWTSTSVPARPPDVGGMSATLIVGNVTVLVTGSPEAIAAVARALSTQSKE